MIQPDERPTVFLIGTRWFGVLGPCRKLISRLSEQGFRVLVFGQSDDHYARYHTGEAELVEIRMRRSYTTPFADIRDVAQIARLARRLRPVAVHSFNPKPALLSYLAVALARVPHFFVGVTGLGNTFIRAKSLEPLIVIALRRAAKRADFIFFQNDDDVEFFEQKRIGDPRKYKKFVGPGVDLDEFDPERVVRQRPSADLLVVCVSRLIWQKGIREFVEAARLVRASYEGAVTFQLIGEYDYDHPDCVDPNYISEAVDQGVIEHISWTDDVAQVLADADINVLHSYREGAPRAILEASAMKLPTVGSDAIGVRELVKSGETGVLVELYDHVALAEAVTALLSDRQLREQYGLNARQQVAEPLSLENASAAQLTMYDAVGAVSNRIVLR